MSPTLIIVESPAKCKKIEEYLGSGYKCIASYGHIQQLPGIKNINIEENFKPSFELLDSKIQQINKIKSAIKSCKEVMIATDDDREGEGIGWHLCQVFNLPLNTKRIIFHEITKSALQRAVENPGTLNMNLIYAQQARQILDVIVGYKISPVLWANITRNSKTGLSAGRCQTPALRLVYDNQKEIDSSPGKKVYNTTGYFTQKNLPFVLNHNFEIIQFNSSENVMEDFLERSVEFDHIYNCSKPKQTTKNPPIPFTTSSLQQKSSSEYNISPKETMSICQKLYEGGYITYMRTDSTTFSKEFLEKAKTFINGKYGEKYISENIEKLSERKVEKKKSKKKEKDNNAQEAHEAIRPTNLDVENIPEEFSPKERKIYKLIWSVTLESCIKPALYMSITAKITAPLDKEYKCNSEQVEFPGWKIVRGYEKENADFSFLQTLKNKKVVNYNKIIAKVSIKDLKSHFTEAKLVQLLEEKGIGRPSTFSSLIEKIQERGYVKKENVKGKKIKCIDYELVKDELEEIEDIREFGNEKNKLVLQPLGLMVLEFLLKHFGNLFNYEYTKNMENNLDVIAKGNKIWHELCGECLKTIEDCVKELPLNKKESYKIDNKHVFMIGKYGPVIKKEDGETTEFLNVRKDINMEKLKKGEYKLSELLDNKPKDRIIGKYKKQDVYLKSGKFGNYITWGENKKSLNGLDKTIDEIEMDIIIKIIENKASLNPSIVRIINSEISIRKGKFGEYIFYKTDEMNKPKFIKLKGFKGNYNTCPQEEIEDFVEKNK